MKQVWRFALSRPQTMMVMPADAQVLCVQLKDEEPCLWALLDPDAPAVTRSFIIRGTGLEIPDDLPLVYIGTFQQRSPIGTLLVWHVFERSLQ